MAQVRPLSSGFSVERKSMAWSITTYGVSGAFGFEID